MWKSIVDFLMRQTVNGSTLLQVIIVSGLLLTVICFIGGEMANFKNDFWVGDAG